MYVLDKGYREFFRYTKAREATNLCEPRHAYVEMNDARYSDELRKYQHHNRSLPNATVRRFYHEAMHFSLSGRLPITIAKPCPCSENDGSSSATVEEQREPPEQGKQQNSPGATYNVAKGPIRVGRFAQVKNKKFHVNKMYLAQHSTYFEALLLGNFSESKMSEIELKDIDPEHFQDFLEFIYGHSSVEDTTLDGILKLADFFDSKTAIKRCEEFLMEKSEKSLKIKFNLALKYQLEKLKKKCISEMKTNADFLSVVPEDPSQFDYSLWKELFVKAATTSRN